MSEVHTCRLDGDHRLISAEVADPNCIDPWLVVKVVCEIASGAEYYGLNEDKLFILEHNVDSTGEYYEIIEEIPAFLIESEIEDLFR